MEVVGSRVIFMILKLNGGFRSWSLIQDGGTVWCTFQKKSSQKVGHLKPLGYHRSHGTFRQFAAHCRPKLNALWRTGPQ